MKVLLIYPKYPETFWSFKYALKFASKKATDPPLGLLAIASILPEEWEKNLIDLNVQKLKEKDLKGVDLVFISAMSVQRESAKEVIQKIKKKGIKIVAGGPLFTTDYEEFDEVDYLVLNEGEITLPKFLEDLKNGCPKHLYTTKEFADLEKTPIPSIELIDMKKYMSMDIQYSRGCPFNCDFCDITTLFGRKFRTKKVEQIIKELENLYKLGFRGSVFFVDDNFIGNKKVLKNEVLPAIIDWMEEKKYPFTFYTQASIDLADDEELMRLMVLAGFNSVFVGIESPNEESLKECNKFKNSGRDLVSSVRKIQSFGLEVMAGFIIGFDSDNHSIFNSIKEFIEKSKIVTAMIGILNAPKGTRLYQKLKNEKRLIKDISGDNTDFSTNFITKMDYKSLIKGYKNLINKIYSPKVYYKRVKEFLKNYKPLKNSPYRPYYIKAVLKSIWVLGIKEKGRSSFWKFIFEFLIKSPKKLPLAFTFAIYGYHFRRVFKNKYNS